MELEADAGDAAAGDLVGGEGLAVFVGEVEKAVSLGLRAMNLLPHHSQVLVISIVLLILFLRFNSVNILLKVCKRVQWCATMCKSSTTLRHSLTGLTDLLQIGYKNTCKKG